MRLLQKEVFMTSSNSRKKIKTEDLVYRRGIYSEGYYLKAFVKGFRHTYRQMSKEKPNA